MDNRCACPNQQSTGPTTSVFLMSNFSFFFHRLLSVTPPKTKDLNPSVSYAVTKMLSCPATSHQMVLCWPRHPTTRESSSGIGTKESVSDSWGKSACRCTMFLFFSPKPIITGFPASLLILYVLYIWECIFYDLSLQMMELRVGAKETDKTTINEEDRCQTICSNSWCSTQARSVISSTSGPVDNKTP